MDELERWSAGDRERGCVQWRCQPPGDELRLALAGGGERGLGLALEALLDDERRFAVTDQDQGRIQAVRDERRR